MQVSATDLWFSAAENIQRIRDSGVEEGVFPLHADARSLPFAPNFFDAITCIDSYPYFVTIRSRQRIHSGKMRTAHVRQSTGDYNASLVQLPSDLCRLSLR